jgi:hypothetical protein
MKVKVEVTIEVNAEEWAEEYGCEPESVRSDVKRWAQNRLNSYDDELARVVSVR